MLRGLRFWLERRSYAVGLDAASGFFARNSRVDIEAYQLNKFNMVWYDAWTNVPFYRQWKIQHNLPDVVSSLSELERWPILTKMDIRSAANLKRDGIKPSGSVITSGSTGVPLSIPVWNGAGSNKNQWIGRAANGVLPGGKTFLIWGHHHLYGTGWRRVKNIAIRKIKDSLLGYKRISAYDTSMAAMTEAYKNYIAYKPEFVLGYSSSILAFVRCNKPNPNPMPPKLVLCTAGPLSAQEKQEISDWFKAPIAMEYGSVECGVMAHTVDNCDHYNVFWNSHLLQGQIDDAGFVRNIVTNLDRKYFPLIRYDIGDYLDLPKEEPLYSILRINDVIGRPSEIVTLADGTSFFAMLAEACVEHTDGIISHQIVLDGDNIELLVTASRQWTDADFADVRSKLYAVVPALKTASLEIRQVDQLYRNKGGKTPIVYRKIAL